ncbi:MAG: AAA family ATPase [Methanosphaera sp.]|nr:AAA family ATPase [Methanosphaera sp.]
MIINSLTLENFKSHKNTKIDFNENISLILGSNGAGKSSILEAISYSLFKDFEGTIDTLIRKPVEENDIIKKMQVTIEFTHNSRNYLLKRGKTKSKNIAELKIKENDRYVMQCNGDKNVTLEIENLLGLDSKSFLNAVYIRQGDITDLIEKKASEKKELISKLLNIESFERAWEEMKELIQIYENKINSNNDYLSRKEGIEEDIKLIEESITQNDEKLGILKPETEELKKTVLELENTKNKIEIDKTKFENFIESLELQKKLFKEQTLEKEKNESKLKEIEEIENRIIEIEKEVKPLEHLEDLKDTKNKLDVNNEKIRNLTKEIYEIEKNKAIKENKKEAYYTSSSLKEEIDQLRKERKELNDKYLSINSIKTEIKEKENYRDNLKTELQKASEQATKILGGYFKGPEDIEKKTIDEKTKTEKFIDDLTNKINENNNKISVNKNTLQNTRKSLKDLENTQDTCPICQSEISHEKHEELSTKYKQDINELELEIESLVNSNKNQERILLEKQNYQKQINNINIELLKEKNDNFISLIKEIKELKTKIPEEFKDDELLIKMDEDIEEKENKLNDLKEDSDAYNFAVKRLSELTDIDELKKNVDLLNEKGSRLKARCHEIIIKYAVKDNLEIQIKRLRNQKDFLNELKGKVTNKEDISNNIKNMTDKITGYAENINKIERDIAELNYDSENYDEINKAYILDKEKLDENNKKITELETEIKKDKETITNKNKELEELEKIEEEQKHLKDYTKMLNKLRNIYSKDGVQKDLRENVRPLIEKETLDIFNEFDFDYTSLSLDHDYNITLHNKNEELNKDMFSGGEKIVIALALRLGISKVLSKNKTDLLILDEPTIHLDEERRSSLIDIISKINFVPQMIVVTHDDEMEALSSNIIKIQKHDGISSIDNS